MINNVLPPEELAAVSRRKKRDSLIKSIPSDQLEAVIADGWHQIGKKKKRSVRVAKPKPHHVLLEDRVWSSLYRMGFNFLSGERGSVLQLEPKNPEGPTNQIDVFAMDREVAVAIECKSSIMSRREPHLQEILCKIANMREPLARAVASQFPAEEKRRIVLALFTSNIQITDVDRSRAKNLNVALFDEGDLAYYEALTRQIGPAARYQLLCDLIPGKPVSGLNASIPALKTSMGGYDCFLFPARPDYLLKICYISHRAKGKATDIDAYQRMVAKSRLSKIREYIADNGVFPTNIVLSFEPESLQFDRGRQEDSTSGSTFGFLHIVPTYKSAWVIDGQHRLFAYSGVPNASKAELPVLAFSGLPGSKQAELFIDINGEQRRVKKNLLQGLYAELRWNSSDDGDRINAVISKAIQQVDSDPGSPFFGRIVRTDESRSEKRCISLTTVFRALDKPGFFIVKAKNHVILQAGPLWTGDNNTTLRRVKAVLNGWFEPVRELNPEWWELGAADGGGLAMNDGVTISINCLRAVLQHLQAHESNLIDHGDSELVERLAPYSKSLGIYFQGFDPAARERFRQLRGVQGQSRGTFAALAVMRAQIKGFNPDGLDDFQRRESAQTTEQARTLIDRIETKLQKIVIQELQEEFEGGERWWYDGVPQQVRTKVVQRREEDQAKRGGNEFYFDLIDYRTLATHNWTVFQDILGYGKGSKDKRTEWIGRTNEIRKRAFHPSSGGLVSFEELDELKRYDDWLKGLTGSF
jgi:DGQHR domain-containing protein